MAETITLDPAAVAGTRTQIDISAFIKEEGVAWGDSEIEAALADQAVGSSPVDYRLPNRHITIPLSLRQVGGTAFATIRTQLQQKAALFQREGGWLMRQVDSTPLYADVVNATLHLGGSWLQAYRSTDIDAVLTLECVPDWYGAEVTLDTLTGTGSIAGKLKQAAADAVIAGNHPGRVRIVVSDTSGNDQKGLVWGLRSRHYDSSATAALVYEANLLHPINGAAGTALSGASGGTALGIAPPSAVWVPILHTDVGGTAALTHQGSYRVWARGYSANATPSLRLKWGVGSLASPIINDAVALPNSGGFYMLDLGAVRLDPAAVGTHQWGGVVEAQTTVERDSVAIDQLLFQPLDEGAGTLAYTLTPPVSSIQVTVSGTAAIDDSTASPPGSNAFVSPLLALARGGGYSQVQIMSAPGGSHWLKVTGFGLTVPAGATVKGIQLFREGGNTIPTHPRLVKGGTVQAGAPTVGFRNLGAVGGYAAYTWGGPTDLWNTTWTPTDVNNAGFGIAIGFYLNSPASPVTDYMYASVWYTLAAGFTVSQDAVIYSGGTAELRTEGMTRDAGSGVYGPVSEVIGDLPRIPPSGLESRPVELLVKPSRGDFDTLADAGLDSLSAVVKYRPSHLFTT